MEKTWRRLGWQWHSLSGLPQRTQDVILAYLCLAPWIIGFIVFTLGAMLLSFGLAFSQTDMLTGIRFVGLANFETLVHDPLALQSLSVTTRYAFGAIPLGIIISLAIALLLNQDIPARGLWRMLYYLPSVITGVAVAVLWGWVFNPRIGLLNTALNVIGIEGPRWIFSEEWAVPSLIIMSLWGAGGNMLLYLAGLQGVPTALYDAAKIDGANAAERFLHITLPMLSPTILFTVIMGIIATSQLFTECYVITQGGPNNATLSVILYIYRKSFQQLNFGYASLLAWILFIAILFFSAILLKSSSLWVYYEGELRK